LDVQTICGYAHNYKHGVETIIGMSKVLRYSRILVLFSYIISIFFLPRLNTFFGESVHRNLRIEDLFFPIMFLVTVFSIHRRTLNYALGPIIYICYGLLITLFGLLLYSMPPKVLLIWGKEFQYLIGFILFIECMRSNPRLLLYFERMLIAAGLAGLVFLLSRMTDLHRIGGGYGFAHFTEPLSSAHTAWMYFNLFFLFSAIAGVGDVGARTKFIIKICVPFLAAGALLSGTRTSFIVLALFISTYVWKTLQPVKIGLWFMMMAGIVLFAIFRDDIVSYLYSIHADIFAAPLHRVKALFIYLEGKQLDSFMLSRGDSWVEMLSLAFDRYAFIFGGGRGFSHIDAYGVVPSLGLGGDNQYTVNIAEIGIIGSALFFLAIGSVYSFVHRSLRCLYFPYVFVYLIAGMSLEIFQLSRSGQLFWLVAAYFIVRSEGIKERKAEQALACVPAQGDVRSRCPERV